MGSPLLPLFLSVVLLVVRAESECVAERRAAEECVQAVFQDVDNQMEQLKTEKAKCFTENGCFDPATYSSESQEANREARACKKNIIENQLKDKLETCVQREVPNFVLPDIFDKNNKRKGRKGRKEKNHRKSLDHKCEERQKRFDALCPDETSQKTAKECLVKVKDEQRQSKKDAKEQAKEHEKERRQCFKDNVSRECRREEGKMRKALCDCAVEELDDPPILQQLRQCHSSAEVDAEEEEEGREGERIAKRLVRKFCRTHRKQGKRHSNKSKANKRRKNRRKQRN